MTRITADATTLMRQALMTAHDYMMHAKRDIDEMFGDGYAAAHPELAAAYMKTAVRDMGFAILAKELNEGLEAIAAAFAEK
jgi:hypothetical protein